MRRTKVQLAALAFVAGVLAVQATVSADGWFSRMGDPKEVTLTELLRDPRSYVDVEVEFKVYFNETARNYNPYFTRFESNYWGNFSAWPIDARLYEKRDYPRSYPSFFVAKHSRLWRKIQKLDRLESIEIRGVVRDVFKGQPFIEVLDYDSTSTGLRESDIRHVIAGDAQYAAGNYEKAADHYERANNSRLPDAVRADVERRLGDAYFRAGEYGDAEDAYETGLRYAPDSDVLKQGAAASAAAADRARAMRRGKPVSADAPAVAPETEPSTNDPRNGVDEVIRYYEDPAAVEAEVEAWRLELEKRAMAKNGGSMDAVAVSGTEEVQPVEPAAEEASEAPVAVEPEESAEGCAEQPAEHGGWGESEEQPAEETEEPAEWTEEPAEQQPAEETEQPAEETEQPTEWVEQPAEETEQPAEETEQPAEETAEQPTEWVEPPAEEPTEWVEQPAEGMEGCGEAAEETGGEWGDETAAFPAGERVVWVAGQMIPLPRLPFFGCEDVTDDDLRAVIEEIVRNPEFIE